jgi:hypothetical protein
VLQYTSCFGANDQIGTKNSLKVFATSTRWTVFPQYGTWHVPMLDWRVLRMVGSTPAIKKNILMLIERCMLFVRIEKWGESDVRINKQSNRDHGTDVTPEFATQRNSKCEPSLKLRAPYLWNAESQKILNFTNSTVQPSGGIRRRPFRDESSERLPRDNAKNIQRSFETRRHHGATRKK